MKREDLYVRSYRGEEDGFEVFIRSFGGDPVVITKAAGLAPSLPKGLVNFESYAGACDVFELAASQTEQPYFGLKWALAQPDDFRFSGPTLLLMSMAKNARQWLDLAIAYQKVHTNGFSYSYEEDKAANIATGVVAVHPFSPPCRHLLEQAMAGIALLAYKFMPNFQLNLVTFQHSAPEDMTLYDSIFQCPIIFDADRNTLVADHHFIEEKQSAVLTKLASPLIKQYLDWQISKHPKAKQSISMMVAETLPAILGVKGSDVQHVSDALDIHPKKLQRLLRDEGTSYSDILDEVRKNTAARLLKESDISIGRLASLLDYSSDRPFTVAVKRWFGMTATRYRQARRA